MDCKKTLYGRKKIYCIVPVYNAQKYVARCIKSIIRQTYTNWELVVVDDGSDDNSYDIIRKNAYDNPKITLLQQCNCGAGVARNTAIDYLQNIYRQDINNCIHKGYVVFVDSDDYIEDNYFELLAAHDEDIVFIDNYLKDEDGNIIGMQKMSDYGNYTRDEIIRYQMTGKINWGGVRKAVRVDKLYNNNIRYSADKVGEEAVYSFDVMFCADSFGFIDKKVYTYEIHRDSLSNSLNADPWGGSAIRMKKKLQDMGVYDIYANTINAFIYVATVVSLDKMAHMYDYEMFRKRANKRILEMEEALDAKYPIDYKHIDFRARIVKPIIKLKLWGVFYWISNFRR